MFFDFRKSVLAIIAAMTALLFATSSLANARVDLSEGTRSARGQVRGKYETGFDKDAKGKFNLASNAGMDYFVADNFAIGFSIPAEVEFLPELKFSNVGLTVGATFFGGTEHTIVPYVGLDITPRYYFKDTNHFKISAGLNLGLLASLTESVALDFGLEPEIYFPLGEQKWHLEVPFGYLGVRAFF